MIDELLKYIPSLIALARRLLNNHQQDAEDAIQDLGIRLWNKREFLKTIPIVEQKKYACTTLTHICIDYHRRAKATNSPRKNGNADELDEDVYSKPDELDLHTKLEHKEYDVILHNAISSIKKDHHKEMFLMFLNGYKCKEIAEIFRTSINNVTGGIRYARLSISKQINIAA